jgi:hypothetical protein
MLGIGHVAWSAHVICRSDMMERGSRDPANLIGEMAVLVTRERLPLSKQGDFLRNSSRTGKSPSVYEPRLIHSHSMTLPRSTYSSRCHCLLQGFLRQEPLGNPCTSGADAAATLQKRVSKANTKTAVPAQQASSVYKSPNSCSSSTVQCACAAER